MLLSMNRAACETVPVAQSPERFRARNVVAAPTEYSMADRQSREAKPALRETSEPSDERGATGFTQREIEDVEERSSPRTPVIYEIVCRLGEEEMVRPVTSLWWSGVAAGLSISFSLFGQAVLQMHLPDAPWRPLITSFGYAAGFVMVVLSRQQLFTENTITVVLPVMASFNRDNVQKLVRMWAVVFLANMVGTLFAALFCTFTPALSPELRDSMLAVSGHLQHLGWAEMLFRAIGAGFLVAAMVWLLPGAESTQLHVVVLMSWLIAIGGFEHVVAGSIEAFMLALNGQMGVWPMLADFFTPVLTPDLRNGMIAISGQLLEHSWLDTAFMAVGAGFLMAAMVWLLPGAEAAQFYVVVMMTWLIAAGGFTHVVAGSMEAFMLALNGGIGFWAMLGDFFVPVLIGNIIGGTALFALLAYAQVMQEI